MNELEEKLTLLGLTDKQARVYGALLAMGQGSASAIAHKADMKRSTTYVILEELIALGIVALIPKSKKKRYRALHPDILLERRKKEIRKVEESVPEIEALMRTKRGGEKPQVSYFEGIEGMREIYHYKLDQMEDKTIHAFYAIAPDDVQKQLDYFDEYHKERKRLNIKMKGIVPDDEENLSYYRKTDKQYLRDMKVLPKEIYSSNISIEIGDTWVKTSDFINLQGLIIENPEIAKTMREIFEMVWESR